MLETIATIRALLAQQEKDFSCGLRTLSPEQRREYICREQAIEELIVSLGSENK
jgi:hypothetical protein